VSLARFAFQACSFNHSDISPFRINDLRVSHPLSSLDCDKSSKSDSVAPGSIQYSRHDAKARRSIRLDTE
jgi:hypothetical protein